MQGKTDRAAWLKGGDARCNVEPKKQSHPYRLVLLGAPGVGKGTQAELLHARLNACQLSTGDIFRGIKALAECERTPAAKQALDCMLRGDLVPDEIVLSLVAERTRCLRCGGGFLLDGFPRTVAQAEALDQLLAKQTVKLDAVVGYDLPTEQIIQRLSGRRICPKCKKGYHVQSLPPKVAGVCDHCGTALQQRDDDRPEAIRVRLEAYEKNTAPLAEYYRSKGLLLSIPATETPEKTLERTLQALQAKQNGGAKPPPAKR